MDKKLFVPTEEQVNKAWDYLKTGSHIGIFQLEHYASSLCRELSPRSINELADVIALIRPGAKDYRKIYVQSKTRGRKPPIENAILSRVTEPTHGVLLYQEQVLQLVALAAGYSLQEAEVVRRAMGSKDINLMAEQGRRFREGAHKEGMPKKDARLLWEIIRKHSNYSFNKSHAVSYAAMGFCMALLKSCFPKEFIASLIEFSKHEPDTMERLALYVLDARMHGADVRLPSINEALENVEVVGNDIVLPLDLVKNIGGQTVKAINEAVRQFTPETKPLEKYLAIFHAAKKSASKILFSLGWGCNEFWPKESNKLAYQATHALHMIHQGLSNRECERFEKWLIDNSPEHYRDVRAIIAQTAQTGEPLHCLSTRRPKIQALLDKADDIMALRVYELANLRAASELSRLGCIIHYVGGLGDKRFKDHQARLLDSLQVGQKISVRGFIVSTEHREFKNNRTNTTVRYLSLMFSDGTLCRRFSLWQPRQMAAAPKLVGQLVNLYLFRKDTGFRVTRIEPLTHLIKSGIRPAGEPVHDTAA